MQGQGTRRRMRPWDIASSYCLAIADVARALGVKRQTAHELVHATAAAGYVELLPNRDDRRILQVFLTAQGRAELARVRTSEAVWLQLLLRGLGGGCRAGDSSAKVVGK